MKTYLRTLLALLLAVVCLLACVSCDQFNSLLNPTPDNGGNNENENEGNNENTDEIDYENSYRIRFVYSYTAVVQNSAGRREEKQAVKTVTNIYVPHENNGFDDELKQQIADITYHGYSFDKWYSTWNVDEQVGIDEFVYPDGAITGDMTLYGSRGELAGKNITWSVETTYVEDEVLEEGQAPTVQDVILTFTGTGAMFDFLNADAVDVPWYGYLSSATKVVISDGITSVGANSFNGFKKIKSVEFADSIEKIGKNAFAYCSNSAFRTLVIPASVKEICENAFIGAENLREVVLNDGLEKIGSSAFYGDKRIRSIVVPSSLKVIETAAFHPGMKTSSKVNDHALKKVYYKGTMDQFEDISINLDNIWFADLATVYEYFETPRDAAGVPVESSYPIGSYWHYAVDQDNNDTTIPVQYCYALRYIAEKGSSVPFAIHYIPASPQVAVDEDGNESFVYNEDGILVLEAVMTEELVAARDALMYHGYKFVSYSGALSAGDVITDDKDFKGARGNILNTTGGVVWSYDSNKGIITVSLNKSAIAGGASKDIWDVSSSMDTTLLHSNSSGQTYLNKVNTLIIEDGIEYIGAFAFSGFTGIQSVIIPPSVKGIHEFAFDGCSNLISIYYASADGQSVADATTCKVYTNSGENRAPKLDASSVQYDITNPSALSGLKTAVYNETAAGSDALGSYWMTIGEKTIAWTLSALDDGTKALTVSGDDVMMDFAKAADAPWYAARSTITSLTVTKNITALGKNMCSGYAKLAKVSLPASLRVIPINALANTAIVKNTAAYDNGLLIIDGHLIKVDPAKCNTEFFETRIGMISIAAGAFNNCSAIKKMYITSTIQYINGNPLSGVEVVYSDGDPAAWSTVAGDAGFAENLKVFFKSDEAPEEQMSFKADENPDEANTIQYWHKVDGEYVLWTCQHEYTDWVVKSITYDDGEVYYYNPTCTTVGIKVRHCKHDETHVQEWEIAIDPDAHSFTVYEPDDNGTTETAHCNRFGCKATHTRNKEN